VCGKPPSPNSLARHQRTPFRSQNLANTSAASPTSQVDARYDTWKGGRLKQICTALIAAQENRYLTRRSQHSRERRGRHSRRRGTHGPPTPGDEPRRRHGGKDCRGPQHRHRQPGCHAGQALGDRHTHCHRCDVGPEEVSGNRRRPLRSPVIRSAGIRWEGCLPRTL
jgi:hypothetical protein